MGKDYEMWYNTPGAGDVWHEDPGLSKHPVKPSSSSRPAEPSSTSNDSSLGVGICLFLFIGIPLTLLCYLAQWIASFFQGA